jgi:hypothetical protein
MRAERRYFGAGLNAGFAVGKRVNDDIKIS